MLHINSLAVYTFRAQVWCRGDQASNFTQVTKSEDETGPMILSVDTCRVGRYGMP